MNKNLLFVFIIGIITLIVFVIIIPSEAFFWTICTFVSTLFLSLVRPNVGLLKKCRLVSIWDLLAPVVIMILASQANPSQIFQNILRGIFAIIVFASVGIASKILWWGLFKEENE